MSYQTGRGRGDNGGRGQGGYRGGYNNDRGGRGEGGNRGGYNNDRGGRGQGGYRGGYNNDRGAGSRGGPYTNRGGGRGGYNDRGGMNVKFQEEEPVYVPPAQVSAPTIDSKLLWNSKSKSGSFDAPYSSFLERKKNVGDLGMPVQLYTNHFNIKINKIETVFQYDVVFTIEGRKREIARRDYPLLYRAFEEIKKSYKNAFGKPEQSVLDAPKNVYSAVELNIKSQNEFQVSLPEVSDILDLKVTVKAVMKRTTMIPVVEGVRNFLFDKVGQLIQPCEVASVLNIVLGYSARIQKGFDTVGRSIFTDQRGVQELANGKSVWFGTFSSARMEWDVRLNIDMVCKPAYAEDSLVAFACKFCGCDDSQLEKTLKNDHVLRALSKELYGLKVRFVRPDKHVRDQKVVKIVPGDANSTIFDNVDGASGQSQKASVFDFFKNAYQFTLKRPQLPVVHVGNKNRTVYWPMELLTLKSQACPVSKGLLGSQAEQMIRVAAKSPRDRKEAIENGLRSLNNSFKDDVYAKAFGLEIDGKMLQINGRVLSPPKLSYLDKGQTEIDRTPDKGKWKASAQFNTSKNLTNWGILDLVGIDANILKGFYERLIKDGSDCGMTISIPALVVSGRKYEMTQKFDELFKNIKQTRECEKPDLIMVLVFEKDNNLYANVKHLGEIVLKIPTQVVLRKNVMKIDTMLAHNICLKINAKLGGTNQRISKSTLPPVLRRPVMFIGADVTHSSPQDQKPSIAAVVGSMDAKASIYNCLVSVQDRQGARSEERILNMEEMVKKLLEKFFAANNGRKPEKIIYFRDGVSEGQFEEVMNCEISAIQRACKSVQKDGYEPGITFVVVQKRHHTRFFPVDAGKAVKSGNILPGTVVDQEIVHPRQQSFYLASHEGIQGTTKPAHYHLLFDDNNFSANDLQQLSYYLCHLYSRCERSVSYPAPTYYAHLSAFRARHHHNVLIEKKMAHDRSEIVKLENLEIPNYFL